MNHTVSLLAAIGAAGAAIVSWAIFDGLPYIDDGVAALFQAKIFSRGEVTLPLPPHAEFLEQFGVLGARARVGHWCAMYPPGWSAILALGVLAGNPWLVNPLLTAALVAATAALGRSVHDERTGWIAGALTATSPLLLLVGGTHLSHVASALGVTVGLVGVLGLVRTGRVANGALAGAGVGGAFLVRPLDGALLGLLFALPVLFALRGVRDVRRLLPGIAAALGVTTAAVALLLAYNAATTGDPWVPGHEVGMGSYATFGFGTVSGDKVHTGAAGWQHTWLRLEALNAGLLAGPVPALAVVLLPFLLRRARPLDGLLLAGPLVLLGAFAAYWYLDAYLLGRYVASALPLWLVVAARGIVLAHEAITGRYAPLRSVVPLAAAGSLVYLVAVELPARNAEVRELQGNVERTLGRVVETYGIRNAVVFMDAVNRASFRHMPFNDFYATGFVRNDLDLEGDVIYLRNLRARNAIWFDLHPDRDFYHYRYDRDGRRAWLYRMFPCGDTFTLVSVPPRESDLLEFDSARAAPARCEEPTRPPRPRREAAGRR